MNIFNKQGTMAAELRAPQLLPRILSRFDLIAIYFAFIFASYGAAQLASKGWAAIPMLVTAAILFLLPCALAVYHLGTHLPGEGGIYIWTHKAFGPIHGFISGWLSWVPILLLLPLGVTTTTAHIQTAFHAHWTKEIDIAAQIGLIWFEVFICSQRLSFSQNVVRIGFFISLLTAVTVFTVGWMQPIAATPVTTDIASFNIFAHGGLFSAAVLWLLGVEMPFTMGAEYGDHKRTAGCMLLWGTLALMVGYLMGVTGILLCLPMDKIDVTNGVAQAVSVSSPLLGSLVALAIWMAVMSQDVAYLNTYSRLLFVSSIEKTLPAALGRLSRKQVPANAVIVQGIGASLVVLIFANQQSLAVAFSLYLAALVVVWCASLYYIFAALLAVGAKEKHRKSENVWRIPGGAAGRWGVAVWGVAANTIAIYYVFALPWVTDGISESGWRLWIAAIVAAILILGWGLWLMSRRRRQAD